MIARPDPSLLPSIWQIYLKRVEIGYVPFSIIKMLKDSIESLIQRSSTLKPKRKKLLKMYLLGLEDRLKQVDFCLFMLKSLSGNSTNMTSTTTGITFDVDRQAEFYCDTFWTWVYSSLDILAQILNQTENLNLDENKVSFDKIIQDIQTNHPTFPILPILQRINRAHFRKWTKAYRNCANHRRPVNLWHFRETVRQTRSYETSTAPIEKTVRYICDHTMTLKPSDKKKKNLIDRCENTYMNLNKFILKTLDNLLP